MPNRPKPDHTRAKHEAKKAPLEHSGFPALGLRPELLKNIERAGWLSPSPIQLEVIPRALAGHDVLGIAQTGTGKTGAFALPILQALLAEPPAKPMHPYAVILAPTRELVQQIAAAFTQMAQGLPIRVVTVFGGVADSPQISALNAGPEVVVAAPGRLLDLMGRGWLQYANLRYCVLDEADRMLDMGFIQDIRKILNRMPSRKQMMLLSATLPPEIRKLAAEFLYHPQEVRIGVSGPPPELHHELWDVDPDDKPYALDALLAEPHESILVFTRTRHGADKLARKLLKAGQGPLAVLHADRTQNQRDKALAQFRAGEVRTLVATDVASRGLDVLGIELVVNYDVPRDPEDYVHRVGRTARAKRPGLAVTLVTPEEFKFVKKIEQLIGHRIERKGTGAGGNSTGQDRTERVEPEREQRRHRGGSGRPARSESAAPAGRSRAQEPAKAKAEPAAAQTDPAKRKRRRGGRGRGKGSAEGGAGA